MVPGVRDAFKFYMLMPAACLSNPQGRIIIDDGRRFLMRTREKFDVIIIDPRRRGSGRNKPAVFHRILCAGQNNISSQEEFAGLDSG